MSQISPARNQGEPLKENPQGELTCRSEERQSFSKVSGEILLATSGCFCLDQGEQNLGAFDVSDGPAAADEPPQSTRNSANP